jgi:hypothetical protein
MEAEVEQVRHAVGALVEHHVSNGLSAGEALHRAREAVRRQVPEKVWSEYRDADARAFQRSRRKLANRTAAARSQLAAIGVDTSELTLPPVDRKSGRMEALLDQGEAAVRAVRVAGLRNHPSSEFSDFHQSLRLPTD